MNEIYNNNKKIELEQVQVYMEIIIYLVGKEDVIERIRDYKRRKEMN